MTAFLGIDPSLTATGVGIIQAGETTKHFVTAPPKDVPAYANGFGRIRWFYDEFTRLVTTYQPAVVAVEGYAYDMPRKGKSQAHSLGELGGALRMALFDTNRTTLVVAPSTLKKFATGVGKGPKSGITLALYKRWGLEVTEDNEADGTALALLAQAWSDPRMADQLTKAQREALKSPQVVTPPPRVRTRNRPGALQPVAKTA